MSELSKPLYLVFDGADGTGKSTSLRILRRLLYKKGISAFYTAEPAFPQSRDSQAIKHILQTQTLPKKTQANLFVVARKIHIQKVIKPLMKKNRIIISSRSILSNLAYQGDYKLVNGKYEDKNHIMQMNMDIIPHFKDYLPTMNFYFYTKPETEVERLMGRALKEDKFDSYLENTTHAAKLQRSYKFGIKELNDYGSPSMMINADKLNQFDRAEKIYKWIIRQIKNN